jgi:hypothetical protein
MTCKRAGLLLTYVEFCNNRIRTEPEDGPKRTETGCSYSLIKPYNVGCRRLLLYIYLIYGNWDNECQKYKYV